MPIVFAFQLPPSRLTVCMCSRCSFDLRTERVTHRLSFPTNFLSLSLSCGEMSFFSRKTLALPSTLLTAVSSPSRVVAQVAHGRRWTSVRLLQHAQGGVTASHGPPVIVASPRMFSSIGIGSASPGGAPPTSQPQPPNLPFYPMPPSQPPMAAYPYAAAAGGQPFGVMYYPVPMAPTGGGYYPYPPTGGAAAGQQLAELGTPARPLVMVDASAKTSISLWSLLKQGVYLAIVWSVVYQLLVNAMEYMESRNGSPGASSSGSGGGGGPLGAMFGKGKVEPMNLDESQISFADVQGCDEAKEELREIVEFLKNPAKFKALGAKLPKGVLLAGPPGTGKTMLAKAIAKEAGVTFFYADGSQFDELFVGVGARRLRDLFAAAREKSPALIFIDEIDALAPKRGNESSSRQTINQLLTEMDGFRTTDEIIVIGATNARDLLDDALMRPGRFDTTVAVDPPDAKGRAAILETYLAKIKRDASVRAAEIAKGTTGFTGADLANLVNVAAIRAVVKGKPLVTDEEIEYARDRVMMGAENRSKKIPEAERRITAYHEGGHALVALLLENQGADPVYKATIVPRGSGVMGLVQQQPKEDKYSSTRKGMIARLKVCLAGRVAEELVLGNDNVTTGASSDYQQATKIARAMVRRFGFSDAIGVGVDYETANTNEGAMMSNETKERIEKEVARIVTASYEDAKQLLTQNRPSLDRIAENLLAHDTLTGEQLQALVAGRPLPQRSYVSGGSGSLLPNNDKKGGGAATGSGGVPAVGLNREATKL